MGDSRFCGDALWDNFKPADNLTNLPLPTECFAHTVLILVPCLVFWLQIPVLVIQIRLSEYNSLPWTILQSMKWLVSATIVLDKLFLLVLALWEQIFLHINVPLVDYFYPVVMALTIFLMIIMTNECRRGGIRSSGSIFTSWLSFLIFATPEFIVWLTMGSDQKTLANLDFFRYLAYLAYYPLLVLQLVLHCFADPPTIFGNNEQVNCPEESASFLNRLTFWWYNKIVSIGSKKPLELDDLYDLDAGMQPDRLTLKWKREWGMAIKEYEKRKREAEELNERTEFVPLLSKKHSKTYGTSTQEGPVKEPIPLPSIIWSLWPIFKWDFIGASILKLISDLLTYANPGFLSLLITFTEDQSAPFYLGVAYAVALFVSAELRSIFMNSYVYYKTRVGNCVQCILTTAVYEKTLKLSNSARRQKTHGEIVNLMAIDVERFKMIAPQLQQFWSSPMQIIICLILLYRTIGYSVITGVLVMIVIIPANIKISTISKKWTIQQMKLKDDRIRLSNEILSGIKVVKLYAWEPALEEAVNIIRKQEVSLIRKAAVVKTIADMLNISVPFFVALATFATFIFSNPNNILTPQIAFVSITLFNQLRGPLLMAADLIQQTIQCIVSNKRLKEFLVADDLKASDVDKDNCEGYTNAIDIEGASCRWDDDGVTQLNGVQLKVPSGHLLAVVGTVAAGKSSLLNALLGEMDKLRGYVGVRGMVAYVPQQPWIQNRSLRDNILMEMPFNKVVYDEIVEACALKADIEQLPNGDMTEIGEKGINLSGGQKARVALARAVYQDRDVYLLDDPLSAVDAHVARHIFHKLIGPDGILNKKTRILVTHGLSFLPMCDEIAVMQHGTITHVDHYDKLVEDVEINNILKEADHQKSEEETPSESSMSTGPDGADDELEEADAETKSQISKISRKSSRRAAKLSSVRGEQQKLIEKETVESGRVAFKVYKDYFSAMGIFNYLLPFVMALLVNSLFGMSRNLWLSAWSDDSVPGLRPNGVMPVTSRLSVYAGLGLTEIFFLIISMIMMILGGVAASLKLHQPLLHNILRSPLAYFDVTPLGRILNRLSKDIETVDLKLPSNFRFLAIAFINVAQTCFIVSLTTPLFTVFIIPVFIIYILVLRYFINSSRQLQRLASMSRSPMYSHFGETIQGASTIRAFDWTAGFQKQNKEKLITLIRCSYFSMISACWLGLRLELLGNTLIFATAILAVWSKYSTLMTAGAIGLSVSYSLNITFMMNMFVRQVSDTETNIVCVERIREYTYTASEAPWRTQKSLPVGWPGKGRIVFRDYSTRYRPGLELVIKNFNITFLPGEKIGVVGRTGAGKSSLALALFRIVEAAGGQILLDDVDISTIGLHDLRENLTIIPQDPVLFSGTLRFNLDPLNIYSDAELWSALDHSNLRPFVDQLPQGLEHHIDESGDNISVGQRQLVCLTRALLRKSRVLVLDEATAAVDVQTDALIQATIRKQFNQSTVVTIAHRLNTILDYDKILVMDKGKTAEFDTPNNLLNNKKSLFYAMAETAKLV